MSLNYYADFSSFLKSAREKSGITLDAVSSKTHIPYVYLESIERGEYDFASSVLIQGYLRHYAKMIGLNEDAVARQYNLILRKIDYVSSDHHLPPPFIEQTHEPVTLQIKNTLKRSGQWIKQHSVIAKTNEDTIGNDDNQSHSDWTITNDPLGKTDKAVDEEVSKKWLAERRMTNMVTAFCVCLLGLSFVFFLSDPAEPGALNSYGRSQTESDSLNKMSTDQKRIAVTTKARWNLTPALLTEEEIAERERVKKWKENEASTLRQFLISRSQPSKQNIIRVSVHEAAVFLEENY